MALTSTAAARSLMQMTLAIGAVLVCVHPAIGQVQVGIGQGASTQIQARPALGQGDSLGDAPQIGSAQEERLLHALNAQRQKSLVNDTNKLLRLVNEFNAEIARTNPSALNADEYRRLAEIEKLARSVREKMATSVRGTPAFLPPLQPGPF